MANILNTVWYVNYGDGSTTGYFSVAKWATATTYTVGQLVRPNTAPAVGSERIYVCTVPGLSVTEPTWTFTKGAKQAGTVEAFQECTGQPGICGDTTNTPIWTVSSTWTLGQIITNIAGTGWFICFTAGTNAGGAGAQPAGLTTPVLGVTTTDNATSWVCIATAVAGGPVNTGGPYAKFNGPLARLTTAVTATWGAAGDTFFVGDNHAETQTTAMAIGFPSGTGSAPNKCICVDRTVVPPTGSSLKTTATVSTTGASNLFWTGGSYIYGITFLSGDGANNASVGPGNSSNVYMIENCGLTLNNTSLSSGIRLGANGGCDVTLINTVLTFGAAGQSIGSTLAGRLTWKNTLSGIGGTTPTTLFGVTGIAGNTKITLDGIDLGALGSGKTIFGTTTFPYIATLLNCKLGASVTIATTPTQTQGGSVYLINCDSGATGYRQEIYLYTGTLTASTTVYNAATDGVAPISWHVVTTANSSRSLPFECFEIAQWVAAGTYAASLIQITSADAALTNADIWVDTEYLGSSATPISSLVTTAPANILTAGSALAAGSWATGGLGHNYQLAIPSFTQAIAGYVRFKVKVAKASLTLNIDDAVTVA